MAESYFDHTSAKDISLLRKDVQDETDEMGRIAEDAERDVIQKFTKRNTRRLRIPAEAVEVSSDPSIYVFLEGYAEDAADADGYDAAGRDEWSGFADAMRRTIAKVVSHRLRYRDTDPSLESESRGKRSESRRFVDPDWPSYWNRDLKPYDLTATRHAL